MRESILHFIWKNVYFSQVGLHTTEGKTIRIIHPGYTNVNEGPDFLEAKMVIDAIQWAGNVEIHVKSSDWLKHHHQLHGAYDTIILHVVWEDDMPVVRTDGTKVATLILAPYISEDLVSHCQKLIESSTTIPCQESIKYIDSFTTLSMIDRAMASRMHRKAQEVLSLLAQNHMDWEQTAYRTLLKSFGFGVNGSTFERLAAVLPYKVIVKYNDNLFQLESLFFGQAGMLEEESGDSYQLQLKKEYGFLAQKHTLSDIRLHRSHWKFLRMRPGGFPTIRLAQLASYFHNRSSIFTGFIEINENKPQIQFSTPLSHYWTMHYDFGKPSHTPVAPLGKQSSDTIVINTIIPLLFAFAEVKGDESYSAKAIHILERMPAENNKIIRIWKGLGIKAQHASDSQALIELYKNFCCAKACLDCHIGHAIINAHAKD